MTADSGKSGTAITTRCLQVLQLIMGIVSAVLQSALSVVKSTYQMLRPQRPKSLEGEIVLVCIMMQLIVDSAELETARASLQEQTCACQECTYTLLISVPAQSDNSRVARGLGVKLRHRSRDVNKWRHFRSRGHWHLRHVCLHHVTCDVTSIPNPEPLYWHLHGYQFAHPEITFPLILLHFQPTDKKVSNRIWEKGQQEAHLFLIIYINQFILYNLYFKLSLCSECCMLSSG